jgi:hypothetical protein
LPGNAWVILPSAITGVPLTRTLDPLGKKIIEACLGDATQEEYWKLIPHAMFKEF